MNEIILKNQEEESTRFPPIGKGGISQSMVNLSNEGQVKAKEKSNKLSKKGNKNEFNEIKVEDHKEIKDEEKK